MASDHSRHASDPAGREHQDEMKKPLTTKGFMQSIGGTSPDSHGNFSSE
jgi:hypothetical protein